MTMDMIEDDDQEATVYVTQTLETKLTRVIGTLLIPSKLTIRIDIDSAEMGSIPLTNALLNIKTWVETYVMGCVAVSADNEDMLPLLFRDNGGGAAIENYVMLTPGSPTDDVLACLFQAKFQAICGDHALIGMCEVAGDNAMGLKYTFVGDPSDVLPPMGDWVGPRAYFDLPWWHRADPSMLDSRPGDDEDLDAIRAERAMAEDGEIDEEEFEGCYPPGELGLGQGSTGSTESNGRTGRTGFKPVVIDGGRQSDD